MHIKSMIYLSTKINVNKIQTGRVTWSFPVICTTHLLIARCFPSCEVGFIRVLEVSSTVWSVRLFVPSLKEFVRSLSRFNHVESHHLFVPVVFVNAKGRGKFKTFIWHFPLNKTFPMVRCHDLNLDLVWGQIVAYTADKNDLNCI